MPNKLTHIFWDCPMIYQHDGLSRVALKEGKLRTEEMNPGEIICFVNRARNKIKVLASIGNGPRNCVLAYWRGKDSQVLDEMAIQYIAQAFNGSNINYNQALKQAIQERFTKEGQARKRITVSKG